MVECIIVTPQLSNPSCNDQSNLANSMSLLGAYNSATSSTVVDATKQHVHDDAMILRCMQLNEKSQVLLLAL
jgi:hypothetical protein